MVKILLDHQTFSLQRYGGISRYFANLHHALQNKAGIQSKIAALYSENYYIQDFKGTLSNGLGKLMLSKARRRYKWNKQYSKYQIGKSDFDVLHPTYYDPYFLKKTKKPYVITVHDMIHELLPSYFNPNDIIPYQKRLCVQNASHIIAISETTKNDLINILDVEESRITVIHHGYNETELIPKLVNTSKKNNYLLFVGDRAGYKNFTTFVKAISPILHQQDSLELICAGGGKFQIAEQELFYRLKLTHKVNQISASAQELDALYSNALAFVFPSLYEGFGFPILEAFKQNCPIVASDTPCFREIMGNAGVYFNPYDNEDIQNKITAIIEDENLKDNIIKEGSKQLNKFSLESCINKTIEVYKNIS